MSRLTSTTNIAVFVLFLGLALIDAFSARNFARALTWIAFGLTFVVADAMASRGKDATPGR